MFNDLLERKAAGWQPLSAPHPGHHQRGLSIVELMVGLVVAILVGMAAASTAISFTASQRQGIGVAGTAMSTSGVLSSVRDDVATAGLGFVSSARLNCERLNLATGTTVWANGVPFSPLQVERQASGDILNVMYGTRVEAGASARLADSSVGTQALLASHLPVVNGQAVLLSPDTTDPSMPCLVRTVTQQTPAAGGSSLTFTFGSVGLHNRGSFSTPSSFGAGGTVTALGELNWTRYRLQGGDLLMERPMEGTSAVIARNVVIFRLEYGLSSNGTSSAIDQWLTPTGSLATLDNTEVERLRAVRIGLVTRSPQREKPLPPTYACAATDAPPQLFGEEAPVATQDDWQCYRYRVESITVPLRNLVWGLRA
jgi:type IV pilus assembly protein PilW